MNGQVNKPDNFKIEDVVEYLLGTCKTLNEAINALYEGYDDSILTIKDHEYIDCEIFECETCNWWCEVSERVDEEGNCTDCIEE